MPLHPTIEAGLRASADAPGIETLSAAAARAVLKARYAPKAEPLPVARVENRAIPGPAGPISLRLYAPARGDASPVLVFFHGGGFIALDLDTHDDICRQLCVGSGHVVVSVDYRLAPEHPFPAAPEDCIAAARWVADHAADLGGRPDRIVLAGDSAGACLAAATALALRDGGGPRLAGQLLFYPVLDHYGAGRASYRDFATGYGLTAAAMRWYWDQYLPEPERARDPLAAPLRAPSVAGLPPAFVLTAEYDVLRDEGESYAQSLRTAGVPVRLRRCMGLNHGFLKFADVIPEARERLDEACAWLALVGGADRTVRVPTVANAASMPGSSSRGS